MDLSRPGRFTQLVAASALFATWASRLSVAPCCDRPVDHIGVGSQDSAIVVRRDRLAQQPPRERALGLGLRPVRRGGCPHVDFALVPGATAPSREVGRSPLPTRPADPTGSTATSLATAIGATAGDNHVRRPSASWWQLEGAHCLLLAPDLRCVACRVVCVSACPWPRPPPSDPTATPRQPNRTYHLWEAVGAVGGGSWPF